MCALVATTWAATRQMLRKPIALSLELTRALRPTQHKVATADASSCGVMNTPASLEVFKPAARALATADLLKPVRTTTCKPLDTLMSRPPWVARAERGFWILQI